MVVSARLLGELGNMLMRERFRRYATVEEVEELLDGLREKGTFFDEGDPERVVPDDPKDDYPVALAGASVADCIVSGDPHLIAIARLGEDLPEALSPRLPGATGPRGLSPPCARSEAGICWCLRIGE